MTTLRLTQLAGIRGIDFAESVEDAATRVRSPQMFTLFFLLVLFTPHFLLKLPWLGETVGDMLRTTDIAAAFCLFAYALVRTGSTSRISRQEALLIVFLFGSLLASAAFYTYIFMNPGYVGRVGATELLYPLRHIFLFAPVLLALTLQTERQLLSRLGLATFVLSALFIVAMTALYSGGGGWFEAKQSISQSFGNVQTLYMKRMGGIVGETGAYGFHSMFVWYGLIFFAFLSRLTALGYLLLALTPVWLVFVFVPSQTRIIIPACLVFLLAAMFNPVLMRRRTAILVVLAGVAVLAALIGLQGILTMQIPIGGVALMRLVDLFSGASSADSLTSGRLDHWIEILHLWLQNPFFGYSYRSMNFLLEYPTENFFVHGLSEYGLILFSLFCLFLARLWIGVGRTVRSRPELTRAGAVLQAIMISAMVNWQVNDLNTYYQSFPMLLAMIALFMNLRHRPAGKAWEG
jgi:hypothetical protein|tara:strand:- start:36981 stop:38366 length:1386 start_codon:yes stop_codon:yes gene_type:complete